MSNIDRPEQIRYNDIHQQSLLEPLNQDPKIYLSRLTNLILNSIGNNLVLKGLDIEAKYNSLTALFSYTSGYVIQDSTLIEINSTNNFLSIDLNGKEDSSQGCYLGVFLDYNFLDDASIKVFHFSLNHYPTIIYPNQNWPINTTNLILLSAFSFLHNQNYIITQISPIPTLTIRDQKYWNKGRPPDLNNLNIDFLRDSLYLKENFLTNDTELINSDTVFNNVVLTQHLNQDYPQGVSFLIPESYGYIEDYSHLLFFRNGLRLTPMIDYNEVVGGIYINSLIPFSTNDYLVYEIFNPFTYITDHTSTTSITSTSISASTSTTTVAPTTTTTTRAPTTTTTRTPTTSTSTSTTVMSVVVDSTTTSTTLPPTTSTSTSTTVEPYTTTTTTPVYNINYHVENTNNFDIYILSGDTIVSWDSGLIVDAEKLILANSTLDFSIIIPYNGSSRWFYSYINRINSNINLLPTATHPYQVNASGNNGYDNLRMSSQIVVDHISQTITQSIIFVQPTTTTTTVHSTLDITINNYSGKGIQTLVYRGLGGGPLANSTLKHTIQQNSSTTTNNIYSLPEDQYFVDIIFDGSLTTIGLNDYINPGNWYNRDVSMYISNSFNLNNGQTYTLVISVAP